MDGQPMAGLGVVRAHRLDANHMRLHATGACPTGGDVEIVRSPQRIYPPQFDLVIRPASSDTAATDYESVLSTPFPPECDAVIVNHADGSIRVTIDLRGLTPEHPRFRPPT